MFYQRDKCSNSRRIWSNWTVKWVRKTCRTAAPRDFTGQMSNIIQITQAAFSIFWRKNNGTTFHAANNIAVGCLFVEPQTFPFSREREVSVTLECKTEIKIEEPPAKAVPESIRRKPTPQSSIVTTVPECMRSRATGNRQACCFSFSSVSSSSSPFSSFYVLLHLLFVFLRCLCFSVLVPNSINT